MNTISDNPLLNVSGLPRFAEIRPEQVEPALDHLLERGRRHVEALATDNASPTWENFAAPLEATEETMNRFWAPISHLNAVNDSPQMRQAYEASLPKLSEYALAIAQDDRLYRKFKQLRKGEEYDHFSQPQKRIIDNALRDFRLAGVALKPAEKERFVHISQQLSMTGNQFQQNLLDATDGWVLTVKDESQLEGIPSSTLDLAREEAERRGEEGWVFTLQAPSYIPFMTYCQDASLRREAYEAYVTRASETGPNGGEWDNSELIIKLLKLKGEQARLLGFDHYAQMALETRMAEGVERVEGFITDLAERSLEAAKTEFKELTEFACSQAGVDRVDAWDIAYYSEKLRQHRYDYSAEDARPFFPLPGVLKGMFKVVERLYGIRVSEAEPEQVWDQSVQLFKIEDEEGEPRGSFFVDLFSRPRKRPGAWMAECINRYRHGSVLDLPVAFLVCNFQNPVGDRPSLLSHEEVITLFHEFGHGLHHLLTQVDFPSVAGVNGVAWDAVELPSQFMENWCWEREVLDLISGHWEDGRTLPEHLLTRMRAARHFQSGMQMVRQLEFSLFDILLHSRFDPDGAEGVQALLDRVRDKMAVVIPPDFNRFQNSFSHIFGGGYSAGYYSYKWAEVLSADAFSLFEQNGIFDRKSGHAFLRHILEAGGSDDPMKLFVAFRGREPRIEPLLRHAGLEPSDTVERTS